MLALGTINLEEVGKDEGLVNCEKVLEAYDLDHSINMPPLLLVGVIPLFY